MIERIVIVAFVLLALTVGSGAGPESLEKRVRNADPDVRSDAVREVRASPSLQGVRLVFPLLDDDDTYVRDLTWACLTTVKNADTVRWMAGAARADRSARLRAQAADVFGRGQQLAAIPALEALAKDRDPDVRAETTEALGRMKGDPRALEAIRALLADRSPAIRAAAMEGLSRLDPPGAVPSLRAALMSDADEGVRCAALRSIRYGDKDLATETSAWALFRGGWRVRAQAIENALWLRDHRVVEGLIAGMDRVHRARVKSDLFEALARLTGLEIPPQAEDWKRWWEQHGDEWRKAGRVPRAGPREPAVSSARYYGIPIRSDRVCFLLDGSGSMRGKMPNQTDKTKMARAREELLATVERLKDGTKLNVIVFDDEARAFKPELVALDARSRKRLESFVRPLTGRGRTNMYDAIEMALSDDDVDTLFLLSDGAPSRGKFLFKSRILEHVRRLNRTRKITIHTIGFAGRDQDREFLKNLADRCAGQSVMVDPK